MQPFWLCRQPILAAQIAVSTVTGWGKTEVPHAENRGYKEGCVLAQKTKVEASVPASLTAAVVDVIPRAARTGNVGDGKIFVHDLRDVVKSRTGEHGASAI